MYVSQSPRNGTSETILPLNFRLDLGRGFVTLFMQFVCEGGG